MKSFTFKQIAFIILGTLFISFSATSCSKSSPDHPGGGGTVDYGTHTIDPQMAGNWMWTDGSDAGYWDDNGVYQGDGYGFAIKVSADAKGNGSWYQHIYSDLGGGGSYFEVDINYYGYFETDNQSNVTFYPMSGRYRTNTGTDRALKSDELYHPSDGSGRTLSLPAINFTEQGGRTCFISTSGSEQDVFFKL